MTEAVRYSPKRGATDEEIINDLRGRQDITHVELTHGRHVDSIAMEMSMHNTRIRSFECEKKPGLLWVNTVRMLGFYSQIDVLMTYCMDKLFYIDFAKFFGDKYHDKSLCIVEGSWATEQKLLIFTNKGPKSQTPESEARCLETLTSRAKYIEYLLLGEWVNERKLAIIYNYKNLKKLYLGCAKYNGSVHVVKLLSLTHIEDIHIQGSGNTKFIINCQEVTRSSNVVKLELVCHSRLTDSQVQTICMICPKLEHLKLLAYGITDAALCYMHPSSWLKHLDVSYCSPGFSNLLLKTLSKGCPSLEFLDLSHSLPRKHFHPTLLIKSERLKYLNMSHQTIEPLDIRSIACSFPNLIELQVYACPGVSIESLRFLKTRRPDLQIVSNLPI